MININLQFLDHQGYHVETKTYAADFLPTRSDKVTWDNEVWRVLEVNHIIRHSAMNGMTVREVNVRVVK